MIPFHASSARAYYCSNSDVKQKYPEISTIWGGFLTKTPPFPKELQVPTSASNPRRMGAWQVTRATWIDCQEVRPLPHRSVAFVTGVLVPVLATLLRCVVLISVAGKGSGSWVSWVQHLGSVSTRKSC